MLLMKVFQRKSRKASVSHRDTHTLLSDRDLGMRTELDPRLLGSSTHHRDRQLPEVSSATHVDVAGGVFLSPCSRSPSTEDTPHHTVPGGSSFLHPRAVGLPWPPDLAGLGLAAATSTVLSLHWEGTAKIQRDFSREPKHSMTLTQCKTTIREPEIWHTLKHSAMCPILMVEVSYLCWWAFGWGGWSPYLACQSVTTIPWLPEEKKEKISAAVLFLLLDEQRCRTSRLFPLFRATSPGKLPAVTTTLPQPPLPSFCTTPSSLLPTNQGWARLASLGPCWDCCWAEVAPDAAPAPGATSPSWEQCSAFLHLPSPSSLQPGVVSGLPPPVPPLTMLCAPLLQENTVFPLSQYSKAVEQNN